MDHSTDQSIQISMTRKNTASAYFNGEIANEIRERELHGIFITKNKTREGTVTLCSVIRNVIRTYFQIS
jgi:hypothetical protein